MSTSVDIEGKEHGKDESSQCSNQCLKLQYCVCACKQQNVQVVWIEMECMYLNVRREMTCCRARSLSLQRTRHLNNKFTPPTPQAHWHRSPTTPPMKEN